MYDSLGSYQVSLKETEIFMILWSDIGVDSKVTN